MSEGFLGQRTVADEDGVVTLHNNTRRDEQRPGDGLSVVLEALRDSQMLLVASPFTSLVVELGILILRRNGDCLEMCSVCSVLSLFQHFG